MSTGYAFDWESYWLNHERDVEWATWLCADCNASNDGDPADGCPECGYVGEVTA